MESTIVIKVKYGETLRRFSAQIIEEELDLDMVRLREKILYLFNLAPDSDLMLTYIDEDGEVVTLADEDDLCDVVRQSLNPLRINVSVNPEKSERSYVRSIGNSTPMRSPSGQHQMQNFNTSVPEILKSISDRLLQISTNLSTDLDSKGSSLGPGIAGLAELVDTFSKVGLSHLGQNSNVQTGQKLSARSVASESTVVSSDMKDQPVLKYDIAPQEKWAGTKPEELSLEENQSSLETFSKSEEVELEKVWQDQGATVVPPAEFPNFKENSMPEENHIAVKNELDEGVGWNMWSSPTSWGDVGTDVIKDAFKIKHDNGSVADVSSLNTEYLKRCLQDSHTMGVDSFSAATPNEGGCSSAWHSGSDYFNEYPPLQKDLCVPHMLPNPRMAPFKRSYNHGDNIDNIFHRGIRCDGCGVNSIVGLRYKSKVQDDYDLCRFCFAAMGNELDYIIIDRPIAPQQPLKSMNDPTSIHPPPFPQGGSRVKSTKFKLDSRFIQDVNVPDGTIMAPLTPFTKIWRMRNNGNDVWPRGSQLLWIGGDKVSDALTLDVEIPAEGLPVDKELDIAVDFNSPELPGRYISYWRMASPSGQKFGQRVWVSIQVDASLKDTSEVINGLNTNLPPVSSSPTPPAITNMNVEPIVEDSFPEPSNSNWVTELVEPIVDACLKNVPELSFPVFESLLRPIFSEVEASAGQGDSINTDREETLLKVLEEMGFKEADTNKMIVKLNGYDLLQCVNDLLEN